ILEGVEGVELPGQIKTELFASVFETNTNVCATVAEIDEALPALRRAAAAAAALEGLAIGAAAAHPFARPEAQPIVKEERYVTFAGYGGISVRRQGVQGLHVHVGMPSAEACWRCLDAMLPWLPVVLALSANSPWYAGELTGMASNRAPVLAELPRAGAPPAFASYAEWESWVERLVRLGVTEDYTRIWWDARPHPKLGTLEVRVPDQPTDVHLAASFTALLQALCATALEGGLPRDGAALGDRGRADYAQNRWSAARFGPRAQLLHPDGTTYVVASELGAELLELVRPAARRLGGERFLARLDPDGCEADLQLQSDSAEDAAADVAARSIEELI
ncbi:MAG: glutamate---cysteine ligase / carboxylate-amine ligase, partial [Gaiellaceae bacterium]|nr:glutamate---cysteine ligase / carboxylate-amine ligase [Gaiellaceae bacterium]